ncbi:MAG: nucleotide exchange factor GrpE [Prevotella sp.]|nr:nucleotide exchange factor GrpE [Prevotella sp.]
MNKKDINIDELTDCQNNAAGAGTENESASGNSGSTDENASENNGNAEESVSENNDNSETSENADSTTSEEKSPLEEAQEQIAELKDKYLRSVAEFDNYRKRTLKEKAELILNGSEKAVGAVLPVLDDMERAIANGEKTEDVQVLRDGMALIYTKFKKVLESLGVKEIETADADFNTDVHEAIAMVPGMGDDKKGKVLDCVQKGYTINDKVIRHAKVAVGQ